LDKGFLIVGVNASRWGWDELTGSTVEFGLEWSPTASPLPSASGHAVSAGQAYGDDLLLELQGVIREFAQARPSMTEDQFLEQGLGNRSDWQVLSDIRRTPQLPDLQEVLRLPYYRPDHLTVLAEWLADHQATAERQSLTALGRREAEAG